MKSNLGNHHLVAELMQTINQTEHSAISFRNYMDLCLYHESDGYYRNRTPKIGPEGDFYTSSSIGSIMGEILADYIVKTWNLEFGRNTPLTLVEWGGGNGRLALQILDQIKSTSPLLYENLGYIMIESSSYHRELQAQTLQEHIEHVSWMSDESWFARGSQPNTIVLANELLDAFAIHRIRKWEGQVEENFVSLDEENLGFIEHWRPLQNEDVRTYIEDEKIHLREGQVIEVNLDSTRWIKRIATSIETGRLIVIDYGDVAEELYAEHRMLGTLMCYRKHQAADNPYCYVGEQDITAHVNFTACIRAAEQVGFTDIRLQTQRQFLVDQGILHKLQNTLGADPFSKEAKRNRAIRQLLISDSMSELFKVFIACK